MEAAAIGREEAGIRWTAAIWAGIIAGAVFLMLELVMVPVFLGESAWGPPRMIAAIALGQDVLPPPATFDLVIVLVAMMIHFVLSVLYALVLAWFVSRLGTGAAVATGAAYGLALYVVNFYLFTTVFPWFAMARNWVSIVAHILFGVIAAWAYKRLHRMRTA
ncbi:MAG: hypothetical protein ACRELD_13530 [Longimicrobiales bacterium]